WLPARAERMMSRERERTTSRRLERMTSPVRSDPPTADADARARLLRKVRGARKRTGRAESGAPGRHEAGQALLPDWIRGAAVLRRLVLGQVTHELAAVLFFVSQRADAQV